MNYALLIVDPDIRINQQIAQGLSRELQRDGDWTVLVESRHRSVQHLGSRIRDIDPDAVVVREATRGWRSLLADFASPVVAVVRSGAFGDATPLVSTDEEAIGLMAAEYFLEQRFEHFAVAGYPESRVRLDVFSEALRRAGKTPASYHFTTDDPIDHPFSEYDAPGNLLAWLQQLPKPCAVFAHSDQPGAHIVRTCIRHNIRVPEEISVLGVDDDPLFCRTVMPNLASIHMPNARIGAEAARLILDGASGPQEIKVPPTTVVERASCRPPRRGDPLVDLALEHLRRRVADGVRVKDLQTLTGLSSHQLVYRFSLVTGRTPMEMILRQRIAVAKRLLAESDEAVADVAQRSGFRSTNRFYVTFRAQLGISPRDYRAQLTS